MVLCHVQVGDPTLLHPPFRSASSAVKTTLFLSTSPPNSHRMSQIGWGDPTKSNSSLNLIYLLPLPSPSLDGVISSCLDSFNLKGKQGVLSAGAAGVFISQGAGMPEVLQT